MESNIILIFLALKLDLKLVTLIFGYVCVSSVISALVYIIRLVVC